MHAMWYQHLLLYWSKNQSLYHSPLAGKLSHLRIWIAGDYPCRFFSSMYMVYLVRPSRSHDGSYSTSAVMQLQDNHSNDTHTQQINMEILANHLARLTKMDGHTGTQILFNEVTNKKNWNSTKWPSGDGRPRSCIDQNRPHWNKNW